MTRNQPEHPLHTARERLRSPPNPDEPLSRRELVDRVNRRLRNIRGARRLDTHALARLERGVVSWPNPAWRHALRLELGAATDAELGFRESQPRAHSARPPAPVVPMPSRAPRVEEVLMSAADESARFLAWAEATNVGEFTIQDLHSDVRTIASAYLKQPTLPLFARTKALRDRAFALLDGRQTPQQSQELYAAAGLVTDHAGLDVGGPGPDRRRRDARPGGLGVRRAG